MMATSRGADTRDLIMAADIGTSGVKVGVVDRTLALVARASSPCDLALPSPGIAEQDPEALWSAFAAAVNDLHGQIPDLANRVAALSLCAQMCGVIAADEEGRPVRPALIWLDKRSAAVTRALVGGVPAFRGYNIVKLARWLRLANGAPSLTGMDPPGKMIWLRQNEPENWARTCKLLDIKDWLVHRATGRFTTTADCANLTWMMDTRTGRCGWSPGLMRMVGVPPERLPEIVDGTDIVGGLTGSAARQLRLPEGLPVTGGSGDACATALGSGALGDGELHIYVGTSSWIGGFFPTRRLAVREAYATIASAVSGRPLLIATQQSAGACFSWMSRVLRRSGDGNDADTIPSIIETPLAIDVGERPPMFLPWLAGERVPADDADLRGAFIGLSLIDDQESLVRAVLEGVALNTRWAFNSVSRQPGTRSSGAVPLVGGAAVSGRFCQMLADSLGCALRVAPLPQMAGVRGAARLAASALGWQETPWDLPTVTDETSIIFAPDAERARYFDQRFTLFLDAARMSRPWFRRAHALRGPQRRINS